MDLGNPGLGTECSQLLVEKIVVAYLMMLQTMCSGNTPPTYEKLSRLCERQLGAQLY
jgi:hypothetical protein